MKHHPVLAVAPLLVVLSAAGCGAVTATASAPSPNFVATHRLPGTFAVDVSRVPDVETCSQTEGMRDFCVAGFRKAIAYGVDTVMASYMTRGKQGGADVLARFELVQFSHAPAAVRWDGAAVAATVSMRWRLVLTDRTGRVFGGAAETTVGPKPIADPADADSVIAELLNAVMERVAVSISTVQYGGEARSATAALP